MNLQDKVMVITGAGSGLGKALTFAFAKHNAKIVASGKNSKQS